MGKVGEQEFYYFVNGNPILVLLFSVDSNKANAIL